VSRERGAGGERGEVGGEKGQEQRGKAKGEGGMSDVDLRDWIEKLVQHESEQRQLQFSEAKVAMGLAKETIDHRLEGMNELRSRFTASAACL